MQERRNGEAGQDGLGGQREKRERNQCRGPRFRDEPWSPSKEAPTQGQDPEDGRAISGNILHDYPSPTQKELGLRETRGP